jgi:pyruvyltransferase
MRQINNFKKKVFSLAWKLNYKGIMSSFRADDVLVKYWDYDQNWGDSINEFIFTSILERKVASANRVFNFRKRELITGIGSVLNGTLSNYSIWGSGFLSERNQLLNPPNELLAIRGKLSGKKISDTFGLSTDMMGDPGLLFCEYFNPSMKKEYEVGIIPHFKELDEKVVAEIGDCYGSEVNIISPRLDVFEFARQVKKCERILSSSLHGLVLAESYGIPTARIKISEKLIGGDFKFMDYYSGVGIDFHQLSSHSLDDLWKSGNVLKATTDLKELSFDKEGLINSLKNKFLNN